MKEKIIAKALGLVMNKKIRMAVKIVSMLFWIGEKGIDIYEEFADSVDHEIMIDKKVKNEVRNEIARVMRSNGAQEEKIKEFLTSVS